MLGYMRDEAFNCRWHLAQGDQLVQRVPFGQQRGGLGGSGHILTGYELEVTEPGLAAVVFLKT